MDGLGFQRRLQPARVEVVVLDGVAGAQDVRVFQAGNGAHRRQLDVERQAGGNPVRIIFVRGQAFRLQEDLVAVLVGETVDLVLDRRAVARADTFDHAGEHRAALETAADDVVGALVGVGDPAWQLLRVHRAAAAVGEHRLRGIARLRFHHAEIDAAAIDARRGAGLQAPDRQAQLAQAFAQRRCRGIAGATAAVVFQPDVDLAGQEGAGGEHHALAAEGDADGGDGAGDTVALDQEVVHRLLEQRQVGLVFQHLADRRLVQHAVGLGAGGAHCRTLGGVEGAELDAADVGGQRHGAAERVHFFYQMTLADAADRRVARHLPQRLDIVGQQQGVAAHARGRQRGFGTGMAAAHHDHVKGRRINHEMPAC